jgi:general transcription factor 3C polypeptide 3 (transcription factor C subunit 4)
MARGGSKRHPFAIAPFAYNIPGAALPHDTDSELALDPALTVFYPEEDLELPSRDSEDSDKDDEDDGNSENPPERPKEWQIVTSVRPMNDAPSMSGDENFLTDSDKENSNEDQSDSSDLDLSPDEFPSEDEEADSRARRRGPQRRGPTRGRGGKGGASTQSKETIRGVKGPPDGNTRKTPSKRSKKYKTPEQTAEFRRINGLVTAAWLKEDYDTALRHARDAVQLDPTHFSLHATIADILQMKGREKDATDALFVGIQFTKIPQNWWYVVDHLSTLKSNLKATRKKLIYCYTNILRMPGGDHYQARIRRMRCYQEHGSYRRAQVDCIALLKLEPGNVELLKTLAELSNTLEDPVGALEPFESFVQLNMEHSYSEESALSWEIASIYIELLAQAEKLEDGIDTLRRVSRWILGREEENYWDDLKDDREWDIDDSRRIKADSFEADRFDTELYGLGLPIEFRVRLATLRIQLQPSNIIEAMVWLCK